MLVGLGPLATFQVIRMLDGTSELFIFRDKPITTTIQQSFHKYNAVGCRNYWPIKSITKTLSICPKGNTYKTIVTDVYRYSKRTLITLTLKNGYTLRCTDNTFLFNNLLEINVAKSLHKEVVVVDNDLNVTTSEVVGLTKYGQDRCYALSCNTMKYFANRILVKGI